MKKFKSYPIRYFLADSLSDIIQVVKEAEEKKVRAIGSGHSFSDVAVTNDYFIDIDNLTTVKFADPHLIKTQFHNLALIESEAGIVLKELNKKLDALNVALINMGGIDKQTLAGVISTATHGTGKDLPSIPGFVRSLTIVAAGGKVYRIEPTEGITNPAFFNDPNIKLIQDDATFYSVLVSFGCAGIIYSCIIEVKQQYYLRETKKKTNWEELKLKLLDGSIFSEADDLSNGKCPRSCSLLINPYEIRGDKHYCIVMRHFDTDRPQKWLLFEATRNILSSILGNIPYFFFYTYWLFRVFPHRSPFLIRGSLKGMRDKKFVHKAHKVMYQGFVFVKEHAYDAEFAFDLSNRTNIVKTIEDLMKKAGEIKNNHKAYQSAPIGVRFVLRSKAYLAPEYEKEVAYIDVPFLLGINGNDFMLEQYQEILLKNYGIPHWGKTNTILDADPAYLQTLYPQLSTWKKVIKEFNPDGTFSNKFSERLKLTE
ncbi:MAG TPA: D-arabinono-1,4-lactone oxidase [Chitinophagaceae bacterium]